MTWDGILFVTEGVRDVVFDDDIKSIKERLDHELTAGVQMNLAGDHEKWHIQYNLGRGWIQPGTEQHWPSRGAATITHSRKAPGKRGISTSTRVLAEVEFETEFVEDTTPVGDRGLKPTVKEYSLSVDWEAVEATREEMEQVSRAWQALKQSISPATSALPDSVKIHLDTPKATTIFSADESLENVSAPILAVLNDDTRVQVGTVRFGRMGPEHVPLPDEISADIDTGAVKSVACRVLSRRI